MIAVFHGGGGRGSCFVRDRIASTPYRIISTLGGVFWWMSPAVIAEIRLFGLFPFYICLPVSFRIK